MAGAWANAINAELRANGFDVTIDHRSYERQGVEQIPTVHMGVVATQMELRGIRTERGDINRQIEVTNKQIRSLRARINKLSHWLKEEAANDKPPTLSDVITDILTQQGQSGITRLKAASQMLIFLQRNDIYDMAGLENKVKSMRGKVGRLREDLKPVNRRIETLDKHLQHSENFENYRKFNKRYDELYSLYKTARKATGFGADRKAQKALDAANEYYELHRSELFQFDTAKQYLRDVLQERFDPKKLPPITKWQEERDAKITERDALYREYYSLKDEAKKVEQTKRSVTDILRGDASEREGQPHRATHSR